MNTPAACAGRILATARLFAGVLAAVVLCNACDLAPIDLEAAKPLPLRSTIHAADGTLLARLYKQNRVRAPIDAMPYKLVDAVLAAEDARFFDHPGYDLRAITRAVLVNAREGKIVQGGSTITQQPTDKTKTKEEERGDHQGRDEDKPGAQDPPQHHESRPTDEPTSQPSPPSLTGGGPGDD